MGKNYNRTLNVLLITIGYRGNNDGVQFSNLVVKIVNRQPAKIIIAHKS